MKRLELEGADDIEIRITKRRDGLVVTLTGTGGYLLLQLYQIKGSVTVYDERAATTLPPRPEVRLSAHSSVADAHREQRGTS